ncbi:hypothetical protein BOTBODRAFT_235615 [Botryobasidium botryosum FD-172 SS1]|uniref:VWFA domain-containing protein n=1 Tax=Botryobasidium botryosum (strain FD-172 SS1) TaxID=930990 RepID=A0A067LTZ6_BOTB1|nr:hypothetical protein BOTBODRAFT_235615 [Botryobasidium botryosum FD-172 SS1]
MHRFSAIAVTKMDEDGKRAIEAAIARLRYGGGTNLWAGLKMGMNVFAEDENRAENDEKMVLTLPKDPSPLPSPPPVKESLPALAPIPPAQELFPVPTPAPAPSTSMFARLFSTRKKSKASHSPPAFSFVPEKAAAEDPKPELPLHNPPSAPPPTPPQIPFTQRVSSIFLLTDGYPTKILEPPRGYIPMLQSYLERHPNCKFTINTFGFGYALDSHLLYQIAVKGGGSFGFIPDPGFVGTVFINAGANLLSTYAKCVVDVQVPGGIEVLGSHCASEQGDTVTIEAGNVQYGQTKDFVVRLKGGEASAKALIVTVRYRPWNMDTSSAPLAITATPPLAVEAPVLRDIAYHTHRLTFVTFTLSIFPVQGTLGHASVVQKIAHLNELSNTICTSLPSHANALALADDIDGQVILALNSNDHFEKWGRHYLLSLAMAHQKQQCGNFKDVGLLVYGRNSPLFKRLRDEMDTAFDSLPPPGYRPPSTDSESSSRYRCPSGHHSRHRTRGKGAATPHDIDCKTVSSMGVWNSASAPCFAGHCCISLADSNRIMVSELTRGMQVLTPLGPRRVAALVCTQLPSSSSMPPTIPMCKYGALVITPYHPIYAPAAGRWVFPRDLVCPEDTACDAIYSILLEPDARHDAHAVMIEGVRCVTLGHGLVSPSDNDGKLAGLDVRSHAFLGDYGKILSALSVLLGFNTAEGVVTTGGVMRSRSGLVIGFAKPVASIPRPKARYADSCETRISLVA